MNKTSKKEIAESIADLSMPIAKSIYGDKPNQCIVKRIKEEAEALAEMGIDDLDLLAVGAELSKQAMAGNIYIPRTSSSNSLVYYLLGLSNVNPLPRHTYCPKCHMFYWGNKESDVCPDCGEKLFEDGYDLTFALLKDDIKRIGFKIDYSCSIRKTYSCRDYELKLLLNPLAQLVSKLGLEQEEISIRSFDQEEIIKCLNKNYYSRRYLKEKLLNHQAFIGLPTLGSGMLQDYLKEYKVNNFDELVDLICMMHGTRVYDSCEENLVDINKPNIKDCITSRDDLFKFLKLNQFSDEDAVILCRETRINGSGHLSSLSETKLNEAGVEEKYVSFMKNIRYIFHKGHVVGHTKLEFIIAKIYLEDPIRYYRAFFSLHKDLMAPISENDDFIKRLVETRNYELEKIYLGMIDLMERGFNPKKLIIEIKNEKEK